MYEVDQQDRVVQFEEFPEFPQSSGPPSLLLVANEDRVVVAYGVTLMRHWSGLLTRGNEPIALISFDSVAYMSNPPNLNPCDGHPLANRGLKAYGAFRIENSSWIRQLERLYRVLPGRFSGLRHTILASQNAIFECISRKFDIRTEKGSITNAIPVMMELLGEISTKPGDYPK